MPANRKPEMPTLKLKSKPGAPAPAGDRPRGPAAPPRPPVRGAGSGVRQRPTLAEAQAQRVEREARYQEQLRLRYGERPPEGSQRPRPESPRNARPDAARPTQRPSAQRGNPPMEADRRGRPDHPRSPNRPTPTWDEPQAAATTPAPRAGRNTAFGNGPARPAARPSAQPVNRPPFERADRQERHERHERQERPERPEPTSAPGSLRLSKYMTELGISSRREADEWIAKGWVRVDGRVVSELGSRVMHGQHVTVDAKARYVQAQKVTVLINKPVGYVSGQAEDGYEPALVLVKPANQWRDDSSGTRFLPQHLRSLVPAGRLDIDSVGLLVLTQDGRVAKQLIGENSEVEKEYLVRVASPDGLRLTDEGLAMLRHGLEIDGEPLREARVEWVNEDQLRFVLREGKKRQIRRMCEAVGLQVLGLKRVRIGKIMLGDLPAGQWRYLRMDEMF